MAGSRPRYLDFGFAPWGLEGVTIEYTGPNWPSPSLFVLGPSTCVGSTGMLWKRNAVIVDLGPGIFLAEPGSASAAMLEELTCRAE